MQVIDLLSMNEALTALVGEWEAVLRSLPEAVMADRRNSQHRSIKEIVGHMVDSATNNTHRIVHLQYQQSPLVFPNYATNGNNDRWIALQHYQQEDWQSLVSLWKFSVLHIGHVISRVDAGKLENQWIAGPDKRISLGAMIHDFLPHLQLHLAEIEDLINRK
ncbi:MAG: DinB family protein [Bacteroidales bacterium]|nr:DinB family protein [Bacteroidales bacterium]